MENSLIVWCRVKGSTRYNPWPREFLVYIDDLSTVSILIDIIRKFADDPKLGKNNLNCWYAATMQSSLDKLVELKLLFTKHWNPPQCAGPALNANIVLGQIFRNFHFREKKFFLNLYKQHVRCLLEFSTPVWSPWSESDKETLGKNQKQAVNMVSAWTNANYVDTLKKLNLQSLEDQRDRVNPESWFRTKESSVGLRFTKNQQSEQWCKEIVFQSVRDF